MQAATVLSIDYRVRLTRSTLDQDQLSNYRPISNLSLIHGRRRPYGRHGSCRTTFERGTARQGFAVPYFSKTRSSADADKSARRVWRSAKVIKHSTIPYVRYSFLICAIVTLSLRRAVFTIFDFKKCCDLENWVRVR